MPANGEKLAQDYNFMWCILMALRVIYFWAVIYGTLYLCCELRCAVTWPSLCRPPIHMSACTASPVSLRLRLIWARNLFMVIMVMVMVMVTVMVMVAQVRLVWARNLFWAIVLGMARLAARFILLQAVLACDQVAVS